MNDGLASTFGGGLLSWPVVGQSEGWIASWCSGGWTVIGWSAGWRSIWRGAGCTGGFTGRPLYSRLGSRACGLQLLAAAVSSSLS